MTELNTLILVLKMCGILGMQGDLQPSEAFECRQAEKFVVEYHFNGEYDKYKDYMTYELKRDFGSK
tara:strand:- start:200 stop:397 length:198 start_codon:yes stop_codon:yes gene_type:complete